MDQTFSLSDSLTRRSLSTVGGFLSGLALMIGAVGILLFFTFGQVKQAAQENLSAGEHVILDVRIALEALHANAAGDTCFNTLLQKMRRTQFLVSEIRDIGFFVGDRQFCTTGLGTIFDQQDEAPYTYRSTEKIQFSLDVPIRLLPMAEKHHAIRIKNFNAIVRREIFGESRVDPFEMTTYLWEEGAPRSYLVSGPESFEHTSFSDKALSFDEGRISFYRCSETSPFCVQYHATVKDLAWTHSLLLAAVLVMSTLFGIMVAMLLRAKIKQLGSLAYRMRSMMTSEQVEIHYQPLVSLGEGEVVGAEVLCRLKEKNGSLVPPDQFLFHVQEQGLTWELTKLVLSKALTEAKDSFGSKSGLKLAFNIFPRDFEHGKLLGHLDQVQVPASMSVGFEITECEALEDDEMPDTIKVLQEAGIQVSIDDFGTGYSNFGNLSALGADCLKIDKSFVQHMANESVHSSVVPHMVRMAKSLNLMIVAEGVETPQQAEILRNMNVDIAQGYLFNRPMPAAEFAQWLDEFDFMQSFFNAENDAGIGLPQRPELIVA